MYQIRYEQEGDYYRNCKGENQRREEREISCRRLWNLQTELNGYLSILRENHGEKV